MLKKLIFTTCFVLPLSIALNVNAFSFGDVSRAIDVTSKVVDMAKDDNSSNNSNNTNSNTNSANSSSNVSSSNSTNNTSNSSNASNINSNASSSTQPKAVASTQKNNTNQKKAAPKAVTTNKVIEMPEHFKIDAKYMNQAKAVAKDWKKDAYVDVLFLEPELRALRASKWPHKVTHRTMKIGVISKKNGKHFFERRNLQVFGSGAAKNQYRIRGFLSDRDKLDAYINYKK